MKRNKAIISKIKPILVSLMLVFCLSQGVLASADEGKIDNTDSSYTYEAESSTEVNGDGEYTEEDIEKNEDLQDQLPHKENIFNEIYGELEGNADKIFSILAFLGTLVVGVGYKRGFVPLLRDALSKLKGSIDLAKEESDKNNLITESKIDDINTAINEIRDGLTKSNEELSRINWQFESYSELLLEREKLKCILKGQMDMLYAIFMSSSLPQYQKDEIGEKIAELREELLDYETEKN